MKNYYKILNLNKNATKQEIKKAYRNGALFWHPDKNKALNAKEKFIEIQEAYEILIDDNKRKIYDNLFFSFNSNKRNNEDIITKDNKNYNYQKFYEWVSEIRKNAEKKAHMPYLDDFLTESFHFIDKYGVFLIIIFALLVFLISHILF